MGERVECSVVRWATQTDGQAAKPMRLERIWGFIYLTSASKQTRKNKNHYIMKGWNGAES